MDRHAKAAEEPGCGVVNQGRGALGLDLIYSEYAAKGSRTSMKLRFEMKSRGSRFDALLVLLNVDM